MKGGGERNMTAEEKLAALPARIAQAAQRAAEARRMETRIFTAEAQGAQRTDGALGADGAASRR